MFHQLQLFRAPRQPALKAWCPGSFGEKTRPCSSKAEHSPCKREVAGALPRLGLHFSLVRKFAHVVYWMGTVLLKRLKQVRFLPCVNFTRFWFFRSLVQLVRILTLNQRDPSSILGRYIFPLVAQWRCSSLTRRRFYVQVVVRGPMRYSSEVERSPVKRMIPGSIPGNAAIFHCRLTARLPAHNWNNVGANPASGTNFLCTQFRKNVCITLVPCDMVIEVESGKFPMKAVLQNSYSTNDRQPVGCFLWSVVRMNIIGVFGNEIDNTNLRITPPSIRA